MLKFVNENTIEDEETGINVQIYTNPIPLQDYYPWDDLYIKTVYKGDEIVAVWLNGGEIVTEEEIKKPVLIIIQNALDLYLANKEK